MTWNVEIFLTRSQRDVSGASDTLLSSVWGTGREMPPKSIAQPIIVLFFDLSLFFYFILKNFN